MVSMLHANFVLRCKVPGVFSFKRPDSCGNDTQETNRGTFSGIRQVSKGTLGISSSYTEHRTLNICWLSRFEGNLLKL